MHIRSHVIHTFTVSQGEMKVLLQALKDAKHKEARDLALELEQRIAEATREIERRFRMELGVHYADSRK